jgi:hypothetical protein
MTALSPSQSSTDTRPRSAPRSAATRFALGVTFVAILSGAVYASGFWGSVVAVVAAVAVIAAAFTGWERVVESATSAGLVDHDSGTAAG